MPADDVLSDKQFWRCLTYLTNLNGPTTFEQACEESQVTDDFLYSMISFLHSLNFMVVVTDGKKGKLITPPPQKPFVNLQLSFLEWLQFQTYFPSIASNPNIEFHQEFRDKLAHFENQNKSHDIFSAMKVFQRNHLEAHGLKSLAEMTDESNQLSLIQDGGEEIVQEIEKAIAQNQMLEITLRNNKQHEIFPHKLVHLDNQMSLISEERKDKTMIHLYLKDILEAKPVESVYKPTYSLIEVEDFISGLRAITDTEIRLILKITNPEHLAQKVDHQFFGRPCLIKNPQGDTIWAAYVEPNDSLKSWLLNMGAEVEILDPISFKREFLEYCEDKLKKTA
ncbi:MAG: WYL domain-containing protein [Bacteriovoracaceae bacterium]|nr:WYL domain-containing protein [Bacteriovoracaceae bacterium]